MQRLSLPLDLNVIRNGLLLPLAYRFSFWEILNESKNIDTFCSMDICLAWILLLIESYYNAIIVFNNSYKTAHSFLLKFLWIIFLQWIEKILKTRYKRLAFTHTHMVGWIRWIIVKRNRVKSSFIFCICAIHSTVNVYTLLIQDYIQYDSRVGRRWSFRLPPPPLHQNLELTNNNISI